MLEERFTIRSSPVAFLRRLLLILFIFAFLPLVAFLLGLSREYSELTVAQAFPYELFITTVMTVLQFAIIVTAFFSWYVPVVVVDRREIVYWRGEMLGNQKLANTSAVTHVEVEQGPLARRLNYGTLLVHTSDTAVPARIKDVASPDHAAGKIEEMVEPELAPRMLPAPQSPQALVGGGENQHVEFKSSLMWDYRQQRVNKDLYEPVMKNVTAFMNTAGGWLLIGVADDGEVLGLEQDMEGMRKRDSDGYELVLNNAFNKMIGVEYRSFVDVTFPELSGKMICLLTVRPSATPVFLQHKGNEFFYIRAGNGTQPLTLSQATRYIRTHFGGEQRVALT